METINGSTSRSIDTRASPSAAASLTFEAVERRYGDRKALDGFSLDIRPGEVVCLLGPSGCGKTTALRIASGIEKPTGGRVLINGVEVAGPSRFVPPERRGVGLMFQDFALFPHLSVLDNVAFGLKSRPKAEAHREAMEVLGRVGLDYLAEVYPHTLSGGQQQRVALARAVVPRPAVMLMDEPFSGLDVQLRESIQEETLALLRETRSTAMIVTHDPGEAMRLADRIAVMLAGRLVQAGTAQDLYDHPKDLFVARLFSEINELPVTVRNGAVDTPAGRFPAPGFADGTAATLCLRERSLVLSPALPQAGRAAGVPGRIVQARFLGDITRYMVAVGGLDAPLKIRADSPADLPPGTAVQVEIDPAAALVFPASSPSMRSIASR